MVSNPAFAKALAISEPMKLSSSTMRTLRLKVVMGLGLSRLAFSPAPLA